MFWACAFCWVTRAKPWLGVDDALDVAALQGVPGYWLNSSGFAAEYNISGADSLGILVEQRHVAAEAVRGCCCFCCVDSMLHGSSCALCGAVGDRSRRKGLDFIQIGEQTYDGR